MNKINKNSWFFKWISIWSSDLKYKNSISSCYLVWQTIWSVLASIFTVFILYSVLRIFFYGWIDLFNDMPDRALVIISWFFNAAIVICGLMITITIKRANQPKTEKEVKKREYVLIKSIVGMVKKFCFKIDIVDEKE